VTPKQAFEVRLRRQNEAELRGHGLKPSKQEEERQRLTVADLITRYTPHFQSKKGWVGYRGHLKRWGRAFGKRLASEVVPGHVEDFRRELQALGLTAGTINRHTATLKALYNLAIRDRLLENNPVAKGRIRKLQENGERDRVLSQDEEVLIVPALQPMDRAAFIVSLYGGLRRSETLNLERSDIDFDAGTGKLRKTKAGKVQEFPMTPKVVEALQFACSQHDSEFVFPNEEGTGPMSGDRLLDRLKEVCAQLGLKDGILWHTLRHTFVTRMMRGGVDPDIVKHSARHSSLSVTERYSHTTRDAVRAAMVANDVATVGGPLFPPQPGQRGHLRSV
jgi:integrase